METKEKQMLDYKQQGVLTHSAHVLLMTQDEFNNIQPEAKGFTKNHNNTIDKLWIIRHNTMFPVEILKQH
jgi:hypothetical protein